MENEILKNSEIAVLNNSDVKSRRKNKSWNENFNEFVKFRNENPGDSMPASVIDGKISSLWKWCYHQIKNKNKYSVERLVKLKIAGFNWENLKKFKTWDENYNEFVKFRSNNPGSSMPLSKVDGKKNALWKWCYHQLINKNKLSAERLEKLNNAGFNWENLKRFKSWDESYNEFVKFRTNNPVPVMPPFIINGKKNPLWKWCYNQIINKDKLSEERVKKLDLYGFSWEKKSRGPKHKKPVPGDVGGAVI